MGFKKQFVAAPHLCRSWLRLEPICAGVPLISVLAAGSGLSFRAEPSRNRGGWMQCVITGVWGTLWALATQMRLIQKGKWENEESTVNAWFNSYELFIFQILFSAFVMWLCNDIFSFILFKDVTVKTSFHLWVLNFASNKHGFFCYQEEKTVTWTVSW